MSTKLEGVIAIQVSIHKLTADIVIHVSDTRLQIHFPADELRPQSLWIKFKKTTKNQKKKLETFRRIKFCSALQKNEMKINCQKEIK